MTRLVLPPLVLVAAVGACTDRSLEAFNSEELAKVCIATETAGLDDGSCPGGGAPIIVHCGDVHGVCWHTEATEGLPLPDPVAGVRDDCAHPVNDLDCETTYTGAVDLVVSSDPNSYCPLGVEWQSPAENKTYPLPLATGDYKVGEFDTVEAAQQAVSTRAQCQGSSQRLIMWDCIRKEATLTTRAQVRCSAC